MKILFLTVIPSPYQRQLFSSLSEMDGVELGVLYFSPSAHDRAWGQPKLLPFETMLSGRTVRRLGPSAHWNPTVFAAIDKFAPDLIVVSDYSAITAQFVMRRLIWRRTPFVFWGEVPGFSQRGVLGQAIRRQLQSPLQQASAIAGIGEVAVEAYKDLFPGKPVFNIPYFCDLGPFQQARLATSKARPTVDILFSGQMIERKGLDILLAAFDRVARSHPKLRLLLLGSGPEMAGYRSSVPKDIHDRVLFLGHKNPEDLPSIFASADIFCLPSRHDGWGVVVNEALGAGLPIVVSDAVGAGRDLVQEGKNGFIVPVGNVSALAAALDRLAADPCLRERMSMASDAAAHSWGVEEGARRWIAAAEDMLTRQFIA